MQRTNLLSHMYKITAFALPISGGMVINMLASFIAMMMVARVSTLQLAAGALAVSTFIPLVTIVCTIFYALGILISHANGQQKSTQEIGQIVKNGFWLAVVLMIPSGTVLWNIDKVLILFKQDPTLIAITKPYFHFAAFSLLPTLLGAVMAQFFIGIGRPRFIMFVSIISLPIVVVMSYGFVLGHFGWPKLGLAGVTCSTLITQSVMCISLLVYVHCAKSTRQYQIFSGGFLPKVALCKRIFTLGLPIGIQFGAELTAMAVATYFMGFCGVTALAASQITSQYALLVVMMMLGLSQALSLLVSEAYGKNKVDLVKQYILAAMAILACFFVVIWSFFWLAPEVLIKLYLNTNVVSDNGLIHLAKNLFIVAGIMLWIDGMRNLLSGSLRGLQDSKAPMRIGVICLWGISVPASYLAAFVLNGGPIGLRIGFVSGFVVATIFLWVKVQKKVHLISESFTQPILVTESK